ncbi:hypothetical protein ACFVUH_23790 [Kitasatospora sp. NPDC058032]|uniref:hypothetical protein n=1 Tax=Kitasatospora sp. NPDC058032 TaxID=3346307 RepID=UPI0036DD3F24
MVPGPEAVPAARWLVAAIVREWDVPLTDDAFQDLELCASEVIVDALRFELPEQCGAPCPTHGWGTALGLAAV